jgi:excisionase family DNA binding protein
VTLDAALAAVVREAQAPLIAEIRELRTIVESLQPPQFVSVDEAAKRLSCSPQTVVAMVKRNELVSRRAGRRLLVDSSSLKPAAPAAIAAAARAARAGT